MQEYKLIGEMNIPTRHSLQFDEVESPARTSNQKVSCTVKNTICPEFQHMQECKLSVMLSIRRMYAVQLPEVANLIQIRIAQVRNTQENSIGRSFQRMQECIQTQATNSLGILLR
jgi:hypothetical protein